MSETTTKTEVEKTKEEVSTLRGICRNARAGRDIKARKVRTKSGFKVTAMSHQGKAMVMREGGWQEYPAEGENLDPTWFPTPKKK